MSNVLQVPAQLDSVFHTELHVPEAALQLSEPAPAVVVASTTLTAILSGLHPEEGRRAGRDQDKVDDGQYQWLSMWCVGRWSKASPVLF